MEVLVYCCDRFNKITVTISRNPKLTLNLTLTHIITLKLANKYGRAEQIKQDFWFDFFLF